MKSLMALFWICLIQILLPSCLSRPLPSEKAVDLIEQSCKNTSNHDLCVLYLRSDPRSATADVRGLARILLEFDKTNATTTLQRIGELLKDAHDPHMQQYLTTCDDLYGKVVSDILPLAMVALDNKDYIGSASSIISGIHMVETCQEEFTGPIPMKSPIIAENKIVHDLAWVVLGFIDILCPHCEGRSLCSLHFQ